MKKTYLLTRPEHDDTTYYLSSWSGKTIAAAENRGIRVIDLRREKAVRAEVESVINKFSPALIVFNGHGDEKTVTGHKNQPVIRAGENEKLLKSKIVYTISCSSAKILGPKSVQAGAVSYIGYNDDFIFAYEPEKTSKPVADKTARLFLEHSQRFTESMIKGNSVRESYERSKNLLKENIIKLLGSAEDTPLVRFLWWDFRHFVHHGSLDATI